MTSGEKESIDRRGVEWAIWREQGIRLGKGYGNSCLVNLGMPHTPDYDQIVPVNHIQAVQFNAAWLGLPLELKMVAEVHYCGYGVSSDESKASVATTSKEKAAHCVLTVSTFYRRLDQARERLAMALNLILSDLVLTF